MKKTAVVIGGGISGLATARRFALAGFAVTLLETSDRLGGLIHGIELGSGKTAPAAGTITVDVGAEALAVGRPDTLSLISDLGLDSLLVEPTISEARILAGGNFFKIPHGVLGIPSNLDDPALAQAIGEDAVAEAKMLDAEPWQLEAPDTVAKLVETRLGSVILERLVTPVLAGVHASDPSLLEIDAVAPGLFALAKKLGSLSAAASELRTKAARPGSAVGGLRGGMHGLISALSKTLAQLEVDVQLNSTVDFVEQGGEDASGSQDNASGNWTITLQDGTSLSANALSVATPPSVSSKILRKLPTLSQPLSRIKAVDVTVVALLVDDPNLNSAPIGSGVLVAPNEPNILAKASTHATAKWLWLAQAANGHHIVRLSYGRDGVVPANDNELINAAKTDLKALYGIDANGILDIKVMEWPGSLIQAKAGHTQNIAQLLEALKEFPTLALVGAGLGGNGITGILAKASVQFEKLGI